MRFVPSVLILFLVPVGATSQSVEVENAADENLRQLAERIAEVASERSIPGIKEMLVATGLSGSDSELIARRYMDGLVSCLLDAVQSEADEQGLALDDVLLAIEETLEDPELNEPTIVDTRRVDDKAEDCALNEMQNAGISLELILQHQSGALNR